MKIIKTSLLHFIFYILFIYRMGQILSKDNASAASEQNDPNLFQNHQNILPNSGNFGNKQILNVEIAKQIGSKYNGFITSQGNVLWAGAVNLAFNDFKKQFLDKEDLHLIKPSRIARQTLVKLNKAPFTKSNLKQNAIYVKSGIGNEVIKTINRQVKEKFPSKTTPALKEDAQDDDFISYAYLIKALAYEHQFQRVPGMIWFGKPLPGHPEEDPYMVEAFSAVSKQCRNQIKIIEYQNKNNYFLGFKAKHMKANNQLNVQNNADNQNIGWFQKIRNVFSWIFQNQNNNDKFNGSDDADVIYIMSSDQQDNKKKIKTIDSVIKQVMKAQQTSIDSRPIREKLVEFIMPVIDLDLKHEYQQFKGVSIANSALKNKKFKIVQNIKLRMDEKGVVVQNDAFMGKDQCAIVGNIEININKPFWLILTQQGKHPYLVVKINWLPKKILQQGSQY